MSNLWVTAAAFQVEGLGEEPTEEAVQQRRQRIERHLDRHPGQYYHLPHKWGPSANNQMVHGLIADHDGPTRDQHWEHLPDDVVSLRQPIHEHQGYVYPEMVKEKLREHHSDNSFPEDYGGDYVPGGNDPKFVRHEGKHYLLDGHHRYAMARLMGHGSMWGKVFDTANPDHKQSNCYECHEEDSGWDHDSQECGICRKNGWD